MGIVFIVLIGLMYVIKLQRSIVEKIEGATQSNKNAKIVSAPAAPKPMAVKAEEDSEELIAVISAAVAAVLGRSASSIVVRSIKSVGPQTPSWSTVGRQEQMSSRF
jgi:sodium pump decarboxylase gamma subunit